MHDLVELRFSVYEKANMRMLVHEQALQENKPVGLDRNHQALSSVIFGLASYAFFDFTHTFSLSKAQRASYKKLACEILIQTLQLKDNFNEIKQSLL